MSWFTDLAGKAEDFLVKMDENAAVAAQVINMKDREKSSSKLRLSSKPPDFSDHVYDQEDPPVSSKTTIAPPEGKSLKLDRDSELMASLNSSNVTKKDFPVERENDLLEQENRSLNQEMRKVVQNAKQFEKDLKAARLQLTNQKVSTKSLGDQLSALVMEKSLLVNQMVDKDAELLTLKSQVEALHVNKEYQQQLDHEITQRKSLENDLKLQSANSERERKIYEEELQAVKNELALAHQSHTEYKLRAQRILQDKDKLIQNIKNQQTVEGFQAGELLSAELEQLQQERDLLREEISQFNCQVIQYRKELSHAETRRENDYRSSQMNISTLEERLSHEAVKRQLAESELSQVSEEIKLIREDLSLQKIQSTSRVQQLESELEKLRKIAKNCNSSSAEVELEKRLRCVTETLISKQAALEELQSERNSLMLQLERANNHRDVNGSSRSPLANDLSTHVLLNVTDDAKVTTGVSHRVRYAYSTLDSLNFRLGQALRRRPAARLLIVVYMMILHLWVCFVLFTYSPEMHPAEH